MHHTRSDLDSLRGVLRDADKPLTAREILAALERRGETTFESPHQIATVLGRRARQGEISVIARRPYQYQLESSSAP